jgi:hypothetical protein
MVVGTRIPVAGVSRGHPAVATARHETATLLHGSADATAEQLTFGVAAWSIVHGFASLWLDGNIPAGLGNDPEDIARAVASQLRVRRRGGA